MHPPFINDGEAAKVAFLSAPSSYDGRPPVTVIESSMSWVFLAGPAALKMKKPIRRPFVDNTTLAARRWSCEQEVALNRRLSPKVYEGTLRLARKHDGALVLGGARGLADGQLVDGRVVEVLVRMRRLPSQDMLDQRILHGRVGEAEVERIGGRLADFYGHCLPAETDPAGYRRRLCAYVAETLADLERRAPRELAERAAASCRAQLAELDGIPEMFDERVRGGKVIEGHGDLRPEHVYVGDPPEFIDCLEFRRELRLIDPADELAFLAMECERLGGGAIGNGILGRCAAALGAPFPERLVRFHKSFRACLRARMALWHPRERERWERQAAEYLQLACQYGP